MKIKKLILAMGAAVIFFGLSATTLQRLQSRWNLDEAGVASNENIWPKISCRLRLYVHKIEGKIPELSWSELWGLSQPGHGFMCGGDSLEASIQFSTIASPSYS